MQPFRRGRRMRFQGLSRGAPAAPSWAKRVAMVALTTMLVILAGCGSAAVRDPSVESTDRGFFGWHFHAPFDTSEVKTVAVFVKSQSFRRDLQMQLTEAIIKEINLRSPYRVVGNHEKADSLLTAVINQEGKNLVVEAPTNFARELNGTISLQVKWMRNPPSEADLAAMPTVVTETINWVPEVGETVLSAYNHINQSLAKQIVDMMEKRWFNENDLD
jgi:Lipopolysaccharide-assembly